MTGNLFPPYLNADSDGAAVCWLQAFLHSLGLGLNVECDGKYGPETVEAVRYLQVELGFDQVADLDGNFGPATREALKTHKGIDIDAIPLPDESYPRETTWVGPHGIGNWP